MDKQQEENIMNILAELTVLRVLLEREMYAYQIFNLIKEKIPCFSILRTRIFRVIHPLYINGYLIRTKTDVGGNGKLRHYYRTSDMGKQKLQKLTQKWDDVSDGVGILKDIDRQWTKFFERHWQENCFGVGFP